jgi:hypothetical protein
VTRSGVWVGRMSLLAVVSSLLLACSRGEATDVVATPGATPAGLTRAASTPVAVATRLAQAAATAVPARTATTVPAPVKAATPARAQTSVVAVAPAAPELSDYAISPHSIVGGETLTLTYTITGSGAARSAVLTAAIRPAGSETWLNDTANEVVVTVQPGTAEYTRTFLVPSDSAAGSYDVAWGIMGDAQTGFAFASEPALVAVNGGGSDDAQPSEVATAAGEPSTVAREYYQLLNAGDYESAWKLLSPRLRGELDYDRWVEGFDATASVETPSVSTASTAGDSATVSLTIVAKDDAGSGTVSHTFRGTWGLVLDGDTWKLDSPSIRKAD